MNTVRRVVLAMLVVALCMATGAEAKGKKGNKAARAAGPVITSTITVDGKDYQVRLIPLGDDAKAGKAGKKSKSHVPVVVLDGKKYLVKIVDPNAPAAAKKGKHGKGDAKGGKKAGKGKKKHGKK